MTSKELIDGLYESLIWDERILSSRERELLTNLLWRTQSYANSDRDGVSRTINRALGEVIAQRAHEALGESLTRQLLDQQLPFYAQNSNSSEEADGRVRAKSQSSPAWDPPKGPGPPGPPSAHIPREQVDLTAVVHHGDHHEHYRSARSQSSPAWDPPKGPGPPGPPSAEATTRRETGTVAVAEVPEILRADCVIFDEFLSPAEMDAVLQYAIAQESGFQVSEVIEPGNEGGIIDYRQRRSRVLMDLGPHRQTITDRIHTSLPQVLAKLGHENFKLRDVEAQITASNDGDYFHCHNDNSSQENATREITFVYFFHHEPKKFEGGELRIHDSRRNADRYASAGKYRSVIPQQNQMVFFASSLMHEITAVKCSSRSFADSRFTVNGWLHR